MSLYVACGSGLYHMMLLPYQLPIDQNLQEPVCLMNSLGESYSPGQMGW